MKGYSEYMDNITVDSSLHEKIMSLIAENPASQKQTNYIYRFAAIAACVAILLLSIWAITNLLNDLTPNNGLQNGHIVQEPNSGGPNGIVYAPNQTAQNENEETPAPPLTIHALTFNAVESFMSARMMLPDGYFDYDLTAEQLEALFPSLDLRLSAVANYRSDGTLWFVTASEYELDSARRAFTWTTIHLASDGVLPDSTLLFPRDNPIISDVHGVSVTAFVYGANDEYFRADFVLNGIAYRVETSDIIAIHNGIGEKDGMERLTKFVNKIITGDSADLYILANPTIPKLRNDRLSLAEARLDADFGMFLPQNIPSGFTFESATRLINTRNNSLFVHWSSEFDVISWHVRTPFESDLLNIVSVNDREKFDVSLYSIPWFTSVPAEIHYYFQSPVFLADEFMLDVIMARTLLGGSGRPEASTRPEIIQFGVLFGDVLVEVSMTGVSPQEAWKMFQNFTAH